MPAGTGFPASANVSIIAAGAPCGVREVSSRRIICETGPAPAAVLPPFSGGQGVLHERWTESIPVIAGDGLLITPPEAAGVRQVAATFEAHFLDETPPFVERMTAIVDHADLPSGKPTTILIDRFHYRNV